MVNWVEKASFKKIQRLLEISERELHHEILLTVKNIRELSRSPSPYIITVILRPFPVEMMEGEHYVIADLLNLALGSSSPAKNFETEAVDREPVISTQSGQPSLGRRIPALSPKHLRKTIGVAVSSVFLLQKKGFSSYPPTPPPPPPPPPPQASKKGRRVPKRLKTFGTRVKDFVP